MKKKIKDLLVFFTLVLIINVVLPLITLDLPLLLGLIYRSTLVFRITFLSVIMIIACIIYVIFNYRARRYLSKILATGILMIVGLIRIFVDPMITYSFSINNLYVGINNHMVAQLELLMILSFYMGYILLDVTRIIEKRSLRTTYRRHGVINHYMREN
ncbi:MAG: hypothetical protein GXO43_01120 [Crenarchaeota archaeon]|nr:hypothetical protein [Thermoproteota archaeon]